MSILSKQTNYLPVKELANLLNVSRRTIHNDITALEGLGYVFEKKQGYGIYLKVKPFNSTKQNSTIDPIIRRIEILKILLFEKEHITIQSVPLCNGYVDTRYQRSN